MKQNIIKKGETYMNKKVLIAIIAIVVVIAAVIIGVVVSNNIKNKPENKIIGTWQGPTSDGLDTAFVFKEDGKLEYANQFGIEDKGTYEFKDDDKISIKIELWDTAKEYKYEFKDKETLSLTATDEYSPSYDQLKKLDGNYKFEGEE